jgi:hypothetical protein
MLCERVLSASDNIVSAYDAAAILEAIPEVIEAGLGLKEVGQRCTIVSLGYAFGYLYKTKHSMKPLSLTEYR